MSKGFTIKDVLQSACGPLNQHLEEKSVKKRNKYGNQKTVIDNIVFDSAKEAKRYVELRYLLNTGEISDLELQVEYKLSVCSYIADFRYRKAGETIVEDCKGFKTATYKLKRKLMKQELGIEIKET